MAEVKNAAILSKISNIIYIYVNITQELYSIKLFLFFLELSFTVLMSVYCILMFSLIRIKHMIGVLSATNIINIERFTFCGMISKPNTLSSEVECPDYKRTAQ